MEPNEITLQTLVGFNQAIGMNQEQPIDEIKCNGRRIGFVDHKPNSGIRFIVPITEPTKLTIQKRVKELRQEQGKEPIGEVMSQPPTLEQLEEVLRIQEEVEGDDE